MNPGRRTLLSCLLAFGIVGRTAALTVIGYTPAVNDRFASGFSTAPVPNTSASFLGAGYDLSGIGWNPLNAAQGFTLISDEYFVYAAHYAPSGTIQFFSPALYAANPSDPAAAIITLSVSATTFQPTTTTILGTDYSDLKIGKLSAAIPSSYGISSYPILLLDSLNEYVGLSLLTYGHGGSTTVSPRLGTNILEEFALVDLNGNDVPDSFDFIYDFDAGPAGESYLQSGDSGSPTFVIKDGRLTLIGTHSAIDPLNSPPLAADNFIPIYLNQMAIAGVEFTTFTPEPGRASLVLLGLSALLMRRRRSLASVQSVLSAFPVPPFFPRTTDGTD